MSVATLLNLPDKRRILWCRMFGGLPYVLKSVRVVAHTDKVKFRDMAFPFDITKPSYKRKRTFFYLVDIKKGQIYYKHSDAIMDSELIDLILNQSICKQLVSSLESLRLKDILLYVILTLGTGLPLGYIIGNFLPFG